MNKPADRLLSEQEIARVLTLNAEFVSDNAWSFGPLSQAQDLKTVAARDKEWVAGIMKMFADCLVTNTNGRCEYYPTCGEKPFDSTCGKWQQLKQSMEVKE